MNNFIIKIKKSKFLASFSLLASGSIIAQLIAMLISPLTTRFFTPEQFGEFALFSTAVSLFGPIITMKYDMAIITAKSEEETHALIKLCFLISIMLSIICAGLYTAFFINGENLEITPSISMFIIFILLFAYGVNNIFISHNNKNGLYGLISSVTVIKSMTNNILIIITGLLNFGVYGLVISQIFSTLAGINKQSKDVRNNLDSFKAVNVSSIKRVFIKNKNQLLFNAPAALVTTTIYSSINLFIQSMYSVWELGLYSLSYRVLGIPFSVISANIARVYFDSASKENVEKGSYRNTFIKTLIILASTIIPLILFLALLSPLAFSLVFGEAWKDAGLYVQLLAPMFAVRLIAESLTTSFIVSNKQHKELLFQGALFFGELVLYLLTYIFNYNIKVFLIIVSLLYVMVYTSMIFYMNKLSRGNV